MRKSFILFPLIIIIAIGYEGIAKSATVVNYDSNHGLWVTGITALPVVKTGGVTDLYNVDFVSETYAQVSDVRLVFTNEYDAEAATNAINSIFNLETGGASNGIIYNDLDSLAGNSIFLIPFSVDGNYVHYFQGHYDYPVDNNDWQIEPGPFYEYFDIIYQSDLYTDLNTYRPYYAVFTPVPIPGAVWLLGSCLIGIVGIRKKIKK